VLLARSASSPVTASVISGTSVNRAELVWSAGCAPPVNLKRYEGGFSLSTDITVKTNRFLVRKEAIPAHLFEYMLHVYRFDKLTGRYSDDDSVAKEDDRLLASLLVELSRVHPEWSNMSVAYDGRSKIITVVELSTAVDDPLSVGGRMFRVCLTPVAVIAVAKDGDPLSVSGSSSLASALTATDQSVTALGTALLSFVRADRANDSPAWLAVGNKAFSASGQVFKLRPESYEALKGFHVGLRQSMCGLTLELDLSVSCFLASGDMIALMAASANYSTREHFIQAAKLNQLLPAALKLINEIIKNCKVRLTHLNQYKRVRGVGPIASAKSSEFDFAAAGKNVRRLNVDSYFKEMSAKDGRYSRLQYPFLPTIDVGTSKRPIWVPAELMFVLPGQCKAGKVTGPMTADIIRLAAVRPTERVDFIQGAHSILRDIVEDPINRAFGLSGVQMESLSVPCTILPQPLLQYRDCVVDPGLGGSWTAGPKCYQAPSPGSAVKYGVLLVGEERAFPNWVSVIQSFCQEIEKEAGSFGWSMHLEKRPLCSSQNAGQLELAMKDLKETCSVVVVVLGCDCYGQVKRTADMKGIVTSCARWKNLQKAGQIRGYHTNFVLKMTAKCGGVPHIICRSLSEKSGISSLLDSPCMFMGIDVSHPEIGGTGESVAAVVASTDRDLRDYAARISVQESRREIVSQLEDHVLELLKLFKSKNRQIPKTIIVYRDGVSEGQFQQVLEREVPCIKGAVEAMGYPEDYVKIVVIVCQKGHHTRLFLKDVRSDGYLNPYPGLVVDARCGEQSICTPYFNEFYLNSSVAIQGTAKPCKYALIRDEVGMTVRLFLIF
jgi:eukaryotic translation initiation factor 2C